MPGSEDELIRVRPIFYMFIVSFGWILAANFHLAERKLFFVPYVVSFAAILSIRWKWYQREGNLISSARKLMPDWLARGNFFIRSLTLSIAFLPVNLFLGLKLIPWFSFICCLIGIMVSDLVYWGIGKRFHGKWKRLGFLRMSMASVMISSSLTFLFHLWFY